MTLEELMRSHLEDLAPEVRHVRLQLERLNKNALAANQEAQNAATRAVETRAAFTSFNQFAKDFVAKIPAPERRAGEAGMSPPAPAQAQHEPHPDRKGPPS